MSTLTDLTARLTAAQPPVGGKPTVAQYQQAVREAVGDFGYRVPRVLYATLAVVAGTAAYTLPPGFQRLIELEGAAAGAVRNSDGFLTVYDASVSPVERHAISGNQITFYPTPGYSAARGIWYAAGYPYESGNDAFAGLTAQTEEVVMLRAQANALRLLASATAAGRGFNYQIGDVSVQRLVTQPHAQLAGEMDAAYADACRSLVGFIGARGAGVGGGEYR